ncbi:DUF533 domain-containing protein [uncultured Methylobacterium sp.]|jgi:uncharacterized membrane protein YebE (DUF533 family)|uniref:tellurite resistance TerB family protein n=1 Tax=uncultured Methylobacterium sp. TaxID=157278 RepID=UPI00260C0A08|nr:DUF533 domain-containing protein [uncultured Methylobacterium sp.]
MAEAKRIVDALVRARRGGLAALGGVALVVGLGALALRRGGAGGEAARPFAAADLDEDEATLMLRTMVAATAADGVIDARERERLQGALAEAGIGMPERQWLERELADPASIDEIADRVTTPETAARIYAAARLAIDPDTMQERTFLTMLAEALDLDREAIGRIEADVMDKSGSP